VPLADRIREEQCSPKTKRREAKREQTNLDAFVAELRADAREEGTEAVTIQLPGVTR
jgi:hypothetical protein